MATWRRLILTGLVLAVLSLLIAVGHEPGADGGEPTVAAAVQQDHDDACSTGPSCAPFVIAAETALATSAASPADLRALARSWHRSPHLTDDPPPPRSLA